MKYLTSFLKMPLTHDKAKLRFIVLPVAHTTASSHCCDEALGILVCEALRDPWG